MTLKIKTLQLSPDKMFITNRPAQVLLIIKRDFVFSITLEKKLCRHDFTSAVLTKMKSNDLLQPFKSAEVVLSTLRIAVKTASKGASVTKSDL